MFDDFEKDSQLSSVPQRKPKANADQAKQPAETAKMGMSESPGMVPYLDQLQQSFSFNVSEVPCHTGPAANRATEAMDTNGFAHKGSVVLGEQADLKLVAEEVAHVAQHRSASAGPLAGFTSRSGAAEMEAQTAADNVIAGTAVGPMSVGIGNEVVARGGSKNSKHANQKKKQEAQRKYEEAKAELAMLERKPNKTKDDKKKITKLKKKVKHLKQQADFTGENHSQNAKGNR